ncbi:hypothetical protein GEMRC1_014116 [Eukaryota sp. GEM-RC1]
MLLTNETPLLLSFKTFLALLPVPPPQSLLMHPHLQSPWTSSSFFMSDPTMAINVHYNISNEVLDLIRIRSPHSLSSQPDLWNFLIDKTLCQNATEARSLLRSLSMDSTLNNPNLRLSQYLLAFRQTLSRCR